MPPPLLDTNVFLRHLLQDEPAQSPRATAYLARIERGELKARITDLVVFETVFILQRQYGVPRDEISDKLLPLIDLRGLVLSGKRRYREILDLYVEKNVSLVDAYHAVLMKRLQISEIVSYDRGFDRIPGVKRTEP